MPSTVVRSMRLCVVVAAALVLRVPLVAAQETTGAIEGTVTDPAASVVADARVTVRQLDDRTDARGRDRRRRILSRAAPARWRLPRDSRGAELLPLRPAADRRHVSQSVRFDVRLEIPGVAEAVTVAGGVQLVDTSTNALGRVVTGREIVDLPLNGRNFTQLGLLQTGVAPLTAGRGHGRRIAARRGRPTPSTACGRSRTSISSTARRT